MVIDIPGDRHGQELAFWEAASGQKLRSDDDTPEYHGTASLPGPAFELLVQRLEESEGEARVHLDIHTDDLEAEVARLERLGAVKVRQEKDWWVMRDPAGLLFCVIPDRPEELTDDNSERWQ
ncbi:VOC family protein [Spirillospora sp. NPDC047279]|uniref:VOC family protein n=1 Tax=Spirillospora sp. NPDC047279 TaxID=3155478 RepID=UPI00340D9A5E